MTAVVARTAPQSEDELDDVLSEPRAPTIAALQRCPGDLVVLGAGGKMGPTLARMAARAASVSDGAQRRRVIAVSRFSDKRARDSLERHGIETLSADLLDARSVEPLPEAANVIFMAGQKFGTADAPSRTWMMNVVVPALCARRYAGSRIVAFSTGNVYPLTAATSRGASDQTAPAPVGEYAASCLGRERVFEHYAATQQTRVAIMRLNYAIDLRYGVLTDLTQRVLAEIPIPLAMGHVNVIWQRDANAIALEMLARTATPPFILNVTGTRTLSVRSLAEEIGRRLGKTPRFEGREAADALLSDASRMREQFREPETPLETMLDWVTDWVAHGRPTLGKPTHFEARDGAY